MHIGFSISIPCGKSSKGLHLLHIPILEVTVGFLQPKTDKMCCVRRQHRGVYLWPDTATVYSGRNH